MKKNFMLKFAGILSTVALPFLAACTGDNPIEIENDKELNVFVNRVASLDSADNELKNVYYYACTQNTKDVPNNEARCKEAVEKVKSDTTLADTADLIKIVTRMVTDTLRDTTEKIVTKIDTVELPKKYLTVNKTLNITLTSYEQKSDSIRKATSSDSGKVIGDPDVRFLVRTFIDGDSSGYEPLTAIALDTTKVKKWSGTKTVPVQIQRGIDKLEICPIVIDKKEYADHFDNKTVLDGKCTEVKDIGFIDDKSETENETTNSTVTIKWKWNLFEAE